MSDPWAQGGTNPFQNTGESEEVEEVEEVSAFEGIELSAATAGTALVDAARTAQGELTEFWGELGVGAGGGGEQPQGEKRKEALPFGESDSDEDSNEFICGERSTPEYGNWRAGYDREGERESHRAKGEQRRQWLEGDESNAPCPVQDNALEFNHLDAWEPAIEDDTLMNYIKDETDKLGIEPPGPGENFTEIVIGSQLDLEVNWEFPPNREENTGNVYELYVAKGALVVAVMFRYSGPYGYSVMRAIYGHFYPIETLRHIFFSNIANDDTADVIDNIIREVPKGGEARMKKKDWEPVVHEYGTDDYLTLLGTKVGQVAAYLVMERLALGTRRISRIATWRIRQLLSSQIRFEIEPIEPKDKENPEGTGERSQGTKEAPPRSPTPMALDPVVPEAEPMEVEEEREEEEDAEGEEDGDETEGEEDNDVQMADVAGEPEDEPEEEEEERVEEEDKDIEMSDISSDLTDLSDVADRLDTSDDDRPWRKRLRANADKDPEYEEPVPKRRKGVKAPPAPAQPLRRSKRVLELRAKKAAKKG